MIIYLCDGTPECFFTAVFEAYGKKCIITSDENIQLSLGCDIVRVRRDCEKYERVRRGISKSDGNAPDDIETALRSCDRQKEQICFLYLNRLLEYKKPVKNAFNLPEVVNFNSLLHKITIEVHHLKGFLRFKETDTGIFYAPYSPDNDVTGLLMPHFADRLRCEKFIIHDVKRQIAGLYDGNGWIISRVGKAEICLSDSERTFESLWKKYYKAVNIEERPHERQMKASMPVRYWKFLPEKKD